MKLERLSKEQFYLAIEEAELPWEAESHFLNLISPPCPGIPEYLACLVSSPKDDERRRVALLLSMYMGMLIGWKAREIVGECDELERIHVRDGEPKA